MSLLKTYLHNFLSRAGSYVFGATILSRLLSFLASWIALQFIPNKELGIVLFAYSIISFVIPISGLGLSQSLIRFGALLKTKKEKEHLFLYTMNKGIVISVFIIILLIFVGYFIPFQFEKTYNYLILLSILLLPMFVLDMLKIWHRLNHNNKKFAIIELTFNCVLVISVLILSYFYAALGYATALILCPVFTILFFHKGLIIRKTHKPKIVNITFWKYGFFASLANVATQLLFIIDILLIGYLLKDPEMVTNYRYISIIPFSILFLPRVFITTDFVALTENVYNRNYTVKYIKSYMLLFFMVSVILLFFSFVFTDEILAFFDKNFIQFSDSFVILVIGICGILVLRGLFGNLLSSIGKAHVNYYIVSIALLINVVSNYYLIPKFGVKGAAITSAILMWFTGISSAICFFVLYKKEGKLLLKKT